MDKEVQYPIEFSDMHICPKCGGELWFIDQYSHVKEYPIYTAVKLICMNPRCISQYDIEWIDENETKVAIPCSEDKKESISQLIQSYGINTTRKVE